MEMCQKPNLFYHYYCLSSKEISKVNVTFSSFPYIALLQRCFGILEKVRSVHSPMPVSLRGFIFLLIIQLFKKKYKQWKLVKLFFPQEPLKKNKCG